MNKNNREKKWSKVGQSEGRENENRILEANKHRNLRNYSQITVFCSDYLYNPHDQVNQLLEHFFYMVGCFCYFFVAEFYW